MQKPSVVTHGHVQNQPTPDLGDGLDGGPAPSRPASNRGATSRSPRKTSAGRAASPCANGGSCHAKPSEEPSGSTRRATTAQQRRLVGQSRNRGGACGAPVVGDPLNRFALHRHRATVRCCVLEPLGQLERAVRQIAVVAEGDAHSCHHVPVMSCRNEDRSTDTGVRPPPRQRQTLQSQRQLPWQWRWAQSESAGDAARQCRAARHT